MIAVVNNFRDLMAKSIMESRDLLYTLERDDESDSQLWLVRDHESYNDALGRADQYQVWKGNKRRYVGPSMKEAYADFEKAKKGDD